VKFTGNPYRTYRTRINVNGRHRNTCKLAFTGTVYTGTQTLTRVYVNAASVVVDDCERYLRVGSCRVKTEENVVSTTDNNQL